MSRPLIGASVEAAEAYRSRNASGMLGAVRGVIVTLEAGYGQYPEESPTLWVAIRTASGEEVYTLPEDVRLL